MRRLLLPLVAVGSCLVGTTAVASPQGHDTQGPLQVTHVTVGAAPAYPRIWSMYGIDTVTSDDAWAVGDKYGHDGYLHPLIRHWNGTSWQVALKPHRFSGDLADVVAISRDDVWAVGHVEKGRASAQIEHWDGHKWTLYAHSPHDGALVSVSADAADDIWAVGYNGQVGLVQHWDGQHWRVLTDGVDGEPLPTLYAVGAAGPNDVWAMSSEQLFHWDGSTWSRVGLPTDADPYLLEALSLRTATDGWLVGRVEVERRPVPATIHWDGTQWRRVPFRAFSGHRTLTTVTALAQDDACHCALTGSGASRANRPRVSFFGITIRVAHGQPGTPPLSITSSRRQAADRKRNADQLRGGCR